MRPQVVDSYPPLIVWCVLMVAFLVIVQTWMLALLVVPVAFWLWLLFCARDPGRTPVPEGTLVAPVDGEVVAVREREVEIETSLLSVRQLRLPAAGRIERVGQRRDVCEVTVAAAPGDVVVRSTARRGGRIHCVLEPGAVCAAGRRIGMIPGGTRSALRLPSAPAGGWRVAVGDTVHAGLSALAVLDDGVPGGPA